MKNIAFISAFLVILLAFQINNLHAQKINCLDCHENLIKGTVHEEVVSCGDCHRNIKSEDHGKGAGKNVNCGMCHKAFSEQVETDVHRKLLHLKGDKLPTCQSCHGAHKIAATAGIANHQRYFCGKCHMDNKLVAAYHTQKDIGKKCLECHKKKSYGEELAKSVHQKLSCQNCHSYVLNNIKDHKDAPIGGPTADCYLCHTAIADIHKESIHGISLAEGINEAAQCWDCHGSHHILRVADKSSKAHVSNLVNTCGACHDNPEFIKKFSFAVKAPGKMYSLSVHGKLVESEKKDAATCITCHGSHDIKNRVQPGSKIAGINLPGTCAGCHPKITDEYKQSIHWIGVKKGIREAPACNDCHSEHNIHAINTATKRDEIKKIQDNTCLQCHQNLLLSERYGIKGSAAGKYEDSYHGLAVNRGDKKAAMCVDCHGVHKILPKSHIESDINPRNVVNTCKTCHKDATEVFSKSYSHVTEEKTSARYIEDIVTTIYFWLIVIVIGGMMGHNLLILFHELRKRYRKNANEIRIPRFTKNEIIQHVFLLTSFILLAITGFLLKFPNSWIAKGLYYAGLDETLRQNIHRVSAVIMIILSVYHVLYLVFTSRGRDVLKGILPKIADIKQAAGNVMYYLKLRKNHPDFDNYNYIEKAEYWALIWGTIVMGVTGFILWFPTTVGNWAPVWFIKVCEIVHFYEAILATLAIIVWHWFFVMFHPKEYPISFTSINGQMTLEHYKEEHRLKFHKVVEEWAEAQNGKRLKSKLGHFTKLFISALEKNGINPDELFRKEIESDTQLREYLKGKGLADTM